MIVQEGDIEGGDGDIHIGDRDEHGTVDDGSSVIAEDSAAGLNGAARLALDVGKRGVGDVELGDPDDEL